MMDPFLGELIGTAILMLLGNGVVANVALSGTKGEGSGWIVITWSWGMAVFVAVFTATAFSGAHFNPARDLPPRIMHAILPIPGKRDSDWGYAWIPVVELLIGAVLAAAAYLLLQDPLDVNFR
jgi:glycerol uptake facilitator protein